MTTKNKHGGSRPGAGRPPSQQKTFAKQVYLFEHQLALTSKEIRERIEGKTTEPETLPCECGKHEAQPAHVCPYASEINDDNETLCTCCDKCRYECCLAI